MERSTRKWTAHLLFFACALFFFRTAIPIPTAAASSDVRMSCSSSVDDCYSQILITARTRRQLKVGGPGSYPPRCTGKCGSCTPCFPVHVSVPPGTPVTTEYYPEAWRCKCDNRLFMP